MSEILEEYKSPKSHRVNSFKKFFVYFVAISFVVMAGVYVGNALFGKRSLDVMLDLYNQKASLQSDVQKLQEANSALQKEYFELIGLDPDSYK
ncbi:septum formation initiator [Campylobacter fetus]|uniref:septum formation initiator n=1 Tax=Campylobacter fetus TaxID=196 RepID=UPI00288CA2D6|nr:septum formation initiator [Campylobacter fetus subsp. venerealis]